VAKDIDRSDIKSMVESGYLNEEGYVNVASSFGLSGERGELLSFLDLKLHHEMNE
jgi:hypothetical protein